MKWGKWGVRGEEEKGQGAWRRVGGMGRGRGRWDRVGLARASVLPKGLKRRFH